MDIGKKNNRKKILMDIFEDKHYVPMKIKELAILLNVKKEDREELEEVLNELISEGKIALSKRGKYALAKDEIYTGIFESNERGYGFVTVEGFEEDFFIPEKYTMDAFYHDTVQIQVIHDGGSSAGRSGKVRRTEAKIVKILDHEIKKVVGYYKKSKNFGFVIPDNRKITSDIYIPSKLSEVAQSGQKVVCEITEYGSFKRKPEGKIIEVIGYATEPGADITSIVRAYDIPEEFPEEVQNYLANVPDVVEENAIEGRLDLRDEYTITIDGEDAKDLDDAITISRNGDVYTLGVHIADVSQYVTEGNPLDKEALKRGTSVYLADRVIPMLPRKLSNGICSLNEGVDRLALSCIMDIDKTGKVINHNITETVINVSKRCSYNEIYAIIKGSIDNEDGLCEEGEGSNVDEKYLEIVNNSPEWLIEMTKVMLELSKIIREKRYKRGAIDFDFPESKIILDEKGKVVDIKAYDRNRATKIIEDFMLIANETVAENFFWLEVPFAYRTHETPDNEKMKQLSTFINNFGYVMHFGGDDVHPKELQKLLDNIEGTDEENMISRITLRSMKRAMYSPDCTGHFGLAAKYYCHFTSPIRRYPDLQIHRIIKQYLHGQMDGKYIAHYKKILPEVCKNSSTLERRADEAEREVEKLKKVIYMSDKIGEEYEGVVSGVTRFGMYVELPNTVEGMVRISDIEGDFFELDEEHFELVGNLTNKRYKLGQKVKIWVYDTDKIMKTIDFKLVNENNNE